MLASVLAKHSLHPSLCALVEGSQHQGPSSLWCSSPGHPRSSRELHHVRGRGAGRTDDSRIIPLPASKGEAGQLGSNEP